LKALVNNGSPIIKDASKCKTTVSFSPSAGYPFIPLSPNIEYNVTFTIQANTDKDTVTITITGKHVKFPDYEVYIDGKNLYPYFSPDKGPSPFNLGFLSPWIPIPDGVSVTVPK
jgi:hypothetical protein